MEGRAVLSGTIGETFVELGGAGQRRGLGNE